jgi:hypothetical protein
MLPRHTDTILYSRHRDDKPYRRPRAPQRNSQTQTYIPFEWSPQWRRTAEE